LEQTDFGKAVCYTFSRTGDTPAAFLSKFLLEKTSEKTSSIREDCWQLIYSQIKSNSSSKYSRLRESLHFLERLVRRYTYGTVSARVSRSEFAKFKTAADAAVSIVEQNPTEYCKLFWELRTGSVDVLNELESHIPKDSSSKDSVEWARCQYACIERKNKADLYELAVLNLLCRSGDRVDPFSEILPLVHDVCWYRIALALRGNGPEVINESYLNSLADDIISNGSSYAPLLLFQLLLVVLRPAEALEVLYHSGPEYTEDVVSFALVLNNAGLIKTTEIEKTQPPEALFNQPLFSCNSKKPDNDTVNLARLLQSYLLNFSYSNIDSFSTALKVLSLSNLQTDTIVEIAAQILDKLITNPQGPQQNVKLLVNGIFEKIDREIWKKILPRATELLVRVGNIDAALDISQYDDDITTFARLLVTKLVTCIQKSDPQGYYLSRNSASRLISSGRWKQGDGLRDILQGTLQLANFYDSYFSERWADALNYLAKSQFVGIDDSAPSIISSSSRSIPTGLLPLDVLGILPDVISKALECVNRLWAAVNIQFFEKKTITSDQAIMAGRRLQYQARKLLDFANSLQTQVVSPINDKLLQEILSLISAKI